MEQSTLDWLLSDSGRSTISTLISALALIISLAVTWITLRNKAIEDRRQVRSSVLALLIQVYELRTKNELEKLELRKTGDYQAYNTRTNANTEQLTTITQLAKELIEQNKVPLSASGYSILATALALSGDPTGAAATYWQKAVDSASGIFQKSTLMQNYGTYLYETGNHAHGQRMYEAAAALLAESGAGTFAIGRHHHVHAMTQQQAGIIVGAEDSYATAARYYAAIENEQQRVFAEQSLVQSRNAQTLPTTARAPVDGGASGFSPLP